MMSAREKVAYLKGLLEGSDFLQGDSKTKAIWDTLLDILDEVTNDLIDLDLDQAELENYVDAIDDDLSYLEDEVYEGDDDDDDGSIEIECPECGEVVCFDEDLLYEDNVEVTCFNCGSVVYSSDEEYEEELETDSETEE